MDQDKLIPVVAEIAHVLELLRVVLGHEDVADRGRHRDATRPRALEQRQQLPLEADVARRETSPSAGAWVGAHRTHRGSSRRRSCHSLVRDRRSALVDEAAESVGSAALIGGSCRSRTPAAIGQGTGSPPLTTTTSTPRRPRAAANSKGAPQMARAEQVLDPKKAPLTVARQPSSRLDRSGLDQASLRAQPRQKAARLAQPDRRPIHHGPASGKSDRGPEHALVRDQHAIGALAPCEIAQQIGQSCADHARTFSARRHEVQATLLLGGEGGTALATKGGERPALVARPTPSRSAGARSPRCRDPGARRSRRPAAAG